MLDSNMWVNSLQQSMLLLLILGRWLLPKGDITRDQLSQLLFVYIGMASDIMELHTLFEERPVLHDQLLAYAIQGVWSLSLLQFTLVLTATKARKTRVATDFSSKPLKYMQEEQEKDPGCCESEVWSILIMVFFQDGPFLAVRMYALVAYRIVSYNILFFTSKNTLVILLQFYRLIVLHKTPSRVHARMSSPTLGRALSPMGHSPSGLSGETEASADSRSLQAESEAEFSESGDAKRKHRDADV